MIPTTANCFYALTARGDAAEAVMSEFAPSLSSDIVCVTMMSGDFGCDITAAHQLDFTVKMIADKLNTPATIRDEFNPLYLPITEEQLEEVLSFDSASGVYGFSGFNGNPYTIRQIQIEDNDEIIVDARVQFHKFELPSYEDLVQLQHDCRLN